MQVSARISTYSVVFVSSRRSYIIPKLYLLSNVPSVTISYLSLISFALEAIADTICCKISFQFWPLSASIGVCLSPEKYIVLWTVSYACFQLMLLLLLSETLPFGIWSEFFYRSVFHSIIPWSSYCQLFVPRSLYSHWHLRNSPLPLSTWLRLEAYPDFFLMGRAFPRSLNGLPVRERSSAHRDGIDKSISQQSCLSLELILFYFYTDKSSRWPRFFPSVLRFALYCLESTTEFLDIVLSL